MRALDQVQIESDREFVGRILMELEQLEMSRENLPPTGADDSWQGRAWAEFVERYSGMIYDQALRFTWHETYYQHAEKRRVFLFGKRRALSDAAQDAYLWLLQQLRRKLRYHERMNEMPLADFIKMNLRSRNLLFDYLRWRGGFIPKVLAKCTREEKQVFYGLRLNLSVEEIAATMGLKLERTEVIKEVLKIRDEIVTRLNQSGQMHTLNNESSIAIAVENEEFIRAPEDWSTDDDISLQEMKECFISALRKLTPQELSLLQLFYTEKFTTAEILAAYKQAGIKLPHVDKSFENAATDQNTAANQNATADDVYKALEKTRAKLLKFFQKKCEGLPGATINSSIVLELLKLLGVILK